MYRMTMVPRSRLPGFRQKKDMGRMGMAAPSPLDSSPFLLDLV
jgi:hypothetical protein